MTKPVLLQIACSPYYQECINISKETHLRYCRRHDYEYRLLTDMPEPISWNKMAYKRDLMTKDGPEQIFYIDADAMIVDEDYDLRNALPKDAWLGLTTAAYPWSYEIWHYQIGCSYWRNCPEARSFIDAVLARQNDPDPDHWVEQGAVNRELLENRQWQLGFVNLPGKFNSGGGYWLPVEDAIVAAFHAREDRPEAMRRFLRWQTFKEHVQPYIKGTGIEFGCGLNPVKGAAILVDHNPRVFANYQYHWCPWHWPFWSPEGRGSMFEVHTRDIRHGFPDWKGKRFDFCYASDLMQYLPNPQVLIQTCAEALNHDCSLILVESAVSEGLAIAAAEADKRLKPEKTARFGETGIVRVWKKG